MAYSGHSNPPTNPYDPPPAYVCDPSMDSVSRPLLSGPTYSSQHVAHGYPGPHGAMPPPASSSHGYPGSYGATSAYQPAHLHGGTYYAGSPTYQSSPIMVQVAQPSQESIIIVGGCPACRVGMVDEEFTCLGILCAIFFFPIGLICCLTMTQRRCKTCGAIFE